MDINLILSVSRMLYVQMNRERGLNDVIISIIRFYEINIVFIGFLILNHPTKEENFIYKIKK